ncbi:ATP-binding protein [Nocardia sp. NPDC059091]|uniref:ATP-binding protein n=1 Tax=unclassified Nocardia TaxID=2637762 RepID=UPI0036B60FDB
MTSFVGRSAEQAEIGTQLQTRRLVSLVGPGGVGKTRLAITAAAAFAASRTGGAWFVELGSVTDPAMVPRTVIDTLQLPEPPHQTPREDLARLVDGLATADTLIVLDNCEHLLDPVARLVDAVLSRCPSVRVLITTREPLGIGGETVLALSPLPLPRSVKDDAAILFADRAAAVRPGFTLDEHNLAVVIDICRRLDGLPLAIELAAARTRSLPLKELAARLDDRFRLLTGGSRTAAPRHLGLRAVIDWSWGLLEPDLQSFLARLAVFPAAFSLEAAEQVGSRTDDGLELLSALVDKSLLQLVDGPRPRYRMLETIRAYALERMSAAGVIVEIQAKHAEYYLDMAERAEPRLRTGGQLSWIRMLTAERENLLAALEYTVAAQNSDAALRLAGALSTYWSIGGHHDEALTRIRRALELPGAGSGDARAVAVGGALLNAALSGVKPDGLGASETWAMPRDLAAHPLTVLATPLLALITDNISGGLASVDKALPRGDSWERAMLWLTRAMLDGNNGGMSAIDDDLTSAVTEFRRCGERAGLAFSLLALADVRTTLGDFADAIAALEESIALRDELAEAYGESASAVVQRVWLATARARTGDSDRARNELIQLIADSRGAPGSSHLPLARITLGDLARHEGDLATAAAHYGEAAAELDQAPSFPQLRVLLGAGTALAALASGRVEEARRHLTIALDALEAGVPDRPILATLGTAAAHLLLHRSEPATAAELLGVAATLRGAPNDFDPDFAGLVTQLRAVLGERAYRAAYDRGSGRCAMDALTVIRSALERLAPDRDRRSAQQGGG